jgi:hypothetical protein
MMKHALSPAGTVQPSPDVVARRLGDGGVVVHLPSNQIFELNDTGMRIWELLVEGLSDDAMSIALAAEFDIDREICLLEVRRLTGELHAAGLIR